MHKSSQSGKVDVFVAHAADAKDFTRHLVARLRAANLRAFLDEGGLEEGTAYDPLLERAVKTCAVFLFVVSKRAVADNAYALTELEWATESKRKIFGVFAEGYDHVPAPPEVQATTLIRSRGDRIARTVSIMRRTTRLRLRWFIALGGMTAVLIGGGTLVSLNAKAPEYELTVSGNIHRGTRQLPLVTTNEFKSDDRFSLEISATRPVQIYVAYCDVDKHLQIAPGSGQRLTPGQTIRIPPSSDFLVTPQPGQETIYVVASVKELDTVDQALARVLQRSEDLTSAVPCASVLEMSSNESLVHEVALKRPLGQGAGKDGDAEYRPRGIAVEGVGNSMVSRSDDYGIVIIALRRSHDV